MSVHYPRFSLRTLSVLVTLICVYLGAWEATKSCGVATVQQLTSDNARIQESVWITLPETSSPLPFVVAVEQFRDPGCGRSAVNYHRYFFWAFGYTAEICDKRLDTGEEALIVELAHSERAKLSVGSAD